MSRWITLFCLLSLSLMPQLAQAKKVYGLQSLNAPSASKEEVQDIVPEEEFHLTPQDLKKANFKRLGELLRQDHPIPMPQATDSYRMKKHLAWDPVRFYAMLKKGSPIEDNRTHQILTTSMSYYVLVQQEDYRGKVITLFTKKGQAKYNTSMKFIIPLEQDLAIMPTPSALETYPPRKQSELRLVDPYLTLGHRFLWQNEIVFPFYFEKAFDTNLRGTTAYRLEYQLFYMWDFPLKLGALVNYQKMSWKTDDGSGSWNSTNIGPILLFTIYNWERVRLEGMGSWQSAYRSSLQFDDQYYNMVANYWQVGLQAIIPYWVGGWVAGLYYRQSMVAFQDTLPATSPSNFNEGERRIYSWGINLGYHWDMNL
ncbi:MAG: hypothetical protein WCG27_03960 [Pseudomonadota bacterium]